PFGTVLRHPLDGGDLRESASDTGGYDLGYEGGRIQRGTRGQREVDMESRGAGCLDSAVKTEVVHLLLYPPPDLHDPLEIRPRTRIEIEDRIIREIEGGDPAVPGIEGDRPELDR